MAISVFKTWSEGEVLTASDLNSSFSQIVDGGQSVGFPRTASADFDAQDLILDSDGDTTLDCATDDIAVFTLRGQELIKLDGATDGATVNGFTLYCSATTNDVQVQAQGSDTDISIDLVPKGAGTLKYDGTAFGTVFSRDTGTGTTNVPLVSDIHGLGTVFVPAAAMTPATTNGCSALTQVELTAGQPELLVLDFDGTSDEFALFSFEFPKSWDGGTITAKFHYTVSAATSFSVKWDLQAVAVSDNDAIDVAFGTLQSVTDTFHGTSNDLAVTSATSAITVAGTPTAGDMVFFRVGRDPDNDTVTQDARLIGTTINYTRDALNDD